MGDHGKTALLAVLALPILTACGGIADDFLPDTERGQLELTVERAANTIQGNVTEMKTNDRLRYVRPQQLLASMDSNAL